MFRLTAGRYCQTKAAEPSADPKWRDAEKALHMASPKDLHRFLNWVFKLKQGKEGRKLKDYKKSSALKGNWRYF